LRERGKGKTDVLKRVYRKKRGVAFQEGEKKAMIFVAEF